MAGQPAEPRRLIFLSGTVYPYPPSPTVEKKFRRLAGHGMVTILGWAENWLPRRLREEVTFILLPRLPGIVLRYPLFLLAGLLVISLATRRRATNVLLAQSPFEGVVALAGRVLAGLRAIRPVVVVEVHGDWDEVPRRFRRLWFPRLSAGVLAKAARAVLQRADVVRVISRFTEEKVRQVCPAKPLARFPGFTDLEVFLEPPPVLAEVPGGPFILYVGMLVPSKGIQVLLEAFLRIRQSRSDVDLVLIGSGYAESRYRLLSRKLGLAQSVRFIPPMDQAHLAAWMRAAACLVLPSLSEGLGRVILEAMACARPVIGTNVGGIPEMIEHGVNGYLVPPGDAEALALWLLEVLEDPVRANKMGERGRSLVQKMFTEDGYFQGVERLVELADAVAAMGRSFPAGIPDSQRKGGAE